MMSMCGDMHLCRSLPHPQGPHVLVLGDEVSQYQTEYLSRRVGSQLLWLWQRQMQTGQSKLKGKLLKPSYNLQGWVTCASCIIKII